MWQIPAIREILCSFSKLENKLANKSLKRSISVPGNGLKKGEGGCLLDVVRIVIYILLLPPPPCTTTSLAPLLPSLPPFPLFCPTRLLCFRKRERRKKPRLITTKVGWGGIRQVILKNSTVLQIVLERLKRCTWCVDLVKKFGEFRAQCCAPSSLRNDAYER